MTRPDSLGLVTTIMATAPRPRIRLRRATEAVAPTADFTWVVSAASRDTISPDWALSKKAGDSVVTWLKTSRRMLATTRSPSVMTK